MSKRQPERKMGAAVSALAASLAAPGPGLGQSMYGLPADAPRISFIPVDDISPNPDQPRRSFDPQALEELASSIGHIGLLQPILVRDAQGVDGNRWIIVAGERRWRAVKKLGLPAIAAVVTGRDPDEAALIENVQRADLHPVDLACAVGRLADRHGYGQKELAAALGKSQGEVSRLLRILSLPQEILDDAAGVAGLSKKGLYAISAADADSQPALWAELKAASLGGEAKPPYETGNSDDAGSESPSSLAPHMSRSKSSFRPDPISKAIHSFGSKIGKVSRATLTDDHRDKLKELRDAIDVLIAEG